MIYLFFFSFQQIQNRAQAPQVFVKTNSIFQMFWLHWKTSGKWKQIPALAGLRCGGWVSVTAFISQWQHATGLSSLFLHPLPGLSYLLQPRRSRDRPQPLLVIAASLIEELFFPRAFGGCISSSCWINTKYRPSYTGYKRTWARWWNLNIISPAVYRNSCFQGLSFS